MFLGFWNFSNFDDLNFLPKMSLTALYSYFFLKKITKTIIYLLNLSQNYLERQIYGTILFHLVNFTIYFHIFGEKNTL